MKSFIKISLIAALLMSSVGLYASDGEFSFSVKRVNEKTVTFAMNETQVVDVAIYGANNEALYEKKVNAKKGTSKTYDLSSLPNGNYTFKLWTDAKATEYKIEIKGDSVSVSEPVIINMLNPVLTKMDDVLVLNVENAPKGPIEIEILDQHNGQVFQKVFAGGSTLVKKFDVVRGYSRELTFIIRSADQVVTKTVQM
ncbi:hypothetical protein ABDJ41_04055 [Pedobacter sp. ASV1-7]|uniref:hypothetical protein n=1 Tax=Pedobacter sp. ASV1-7 TaxID=3145237 RepID=UPI0032E8B76C